LRHCDQFRHADRQHCILAVEADHREDVQPCRGHRRKIRHVDHAVAVQVGRQHVQRHILRRKSLVHVGNDLKQRIEPRPAGQVLAVLVGPLIELPVAVPGLGPDVDAAQRVDVVDAMDPPARIRPLVLVGLSYNEIRHIRPLALGRSVRRLGRGYLQLNVAQTQLRIPLDKVVLQLHPQRS